MFDETDRELLAEGADATRRTTRNTAELLVRIARFVALYPDSEREIAHAEIAEAFSWTVSFARSQVALAVALSTRLPATFAAMRAGTIAEFKVRRIMVATEVLSDELAARVEAEVAAQAEQLDANQLSDLLRDVVARADPTAAARTAARSKGQRRVHETPDDGAGVLAIQGDTERTRLAFQRVRAIAQQIAAAGDSRTLDQIMSDVALDCLADKG